ncbi:MAG: hypothetical protein ACE5HV_00740 [Acidobacteriota bacterium]
MNRRGWVRGWLARFASILVLAALPPTMVVASLTGAQDAQELPPVSEVIAAYVAAIGGQEQILSHRSSHAAGRFELPGQGLVGSIDIYAAAPNKLLVTTDFEGVGRTRTGFDGEVGWATDPMMGPRLLRGKELEQLRDEADFYSELHDPANFVSMETVAAVEFDSGPSYKVRLVRHSGREFFEYFDRQTGLMVGHQGTQDSVMGSIEVTSIFADYKEFSGMLVPAKVSQQYGPGQSAVTTLMAVEFDNVPADRFEPPAEIKALLGT